MFCHDLLSGEMATRRYDGEIKNARKFCLLIRINSLGRGEKHPLLSYYMSTLTYEAETWKWTRADYNSTSDNVFFRSAEGEGEKMRNEKGEGKELKDKLTNNGIR
jgi:hypothetical protein